MSSRGHTLHFRPGTYFTVLPRLRGRASSATCELGNAFGRVGPLTLFLVCGIQPDACDSPRLLNQIAGDASSVSRHHLTCGSGEAQAVRLIVKIQNDLSRHSTSPWV